MKMNTLSPEFHDWLHTGLGEAMEEDFTSAPSFGSEAFEERLERLADENRYHPLENRPGERYGVDTFFISDFITPEMQPIFRALAQEFLRKEELLLEPASRAWLGSIVYPFRSERSFTDAYDFRVLSMILLCAEHGSAYSREILISLYKTFYRKEYNILKRMKKLSLREAMDAFRNGADDAGILSRVFVMADLMGIELDRMWNRMVQITNEGYDKDSTLWNMIYISAHDSKVISRRQEEEQEKRRLLEEKYPDIVWVDLEDFDAEDERYQILEDVRNLIETTFEETGAGVDALFGDREFVLFPNAYKALCGTLDMMTDTENLEQVILLAVIRYLSDALARLTAIRNSELNELLHIGTRDAVDPEEIEGLADRDLSAEDLKTVRRVMQGGVFELQTKDERSEKLLKSLESVRQKSRGREPQKREEIKKQLPSAETDGKDERIRHLEEQLAESRRQLLAAQDSVRAQRSLYEEQREYAAALKKQAEERRKEHAELIALRHFIHQLDSPDISADVVPDTAKIEKLKGHRVAIVGGHENWIKKMRRILPGWTYIGASDSLSIDSAVTSVEKIYFYTDIISHKMYIKFMKAAQDKKRPFGYLHGTNISGVVNMVYEDLCTN